MIYELDIYRLLASNPELIGKGMEIHDYKHTIWGDNGKRFEIDLLAEDKEGNLIPIEVKIINEGNGFGKVYEYVRAMKSKYGILVVINPEIKLESKFENVKYVPIYISDIELVSTFNIKLFKEEDIKTFETIDQSSAVKLRNKIKLAKEISGDNSMLKTVGDELNHTDKISYWLRNNGTCYGKWMESDLSEDKHIMRTMRCLGCGKELFSFPKWNHETLIFCNKNCLDKYNKQKEEFPDDMAKTTDTMGLQQIDV